jgi:hypothetical protein
MHSETVAEGEEAVAIVYIAGWDRHDDMSIAVAVAAVESSLDIVDDTEVQQVGAWALLAVSPRRGCFCFGTCSDLDSGFYSCFCCWHGNQNIAVSWYNGCLGLSFDSCWSCDLGPWTFRFQKAHLICACSSSSSSSHKA